MKEQLDIYFPTTPITDRERKEKCIRAGTQNARILEIFREHPQENFTPFEVQNIWFSRGYRNVPITSIRRAITSLTQLGYLIKTIETRQGEYGDINHTWRLA